MTDLSRRDLVRLLSAAPLAHATAPALLRHRRPVRGTRRDVTLLFTNDFHSAFDPVPAFWLPGSPRLGGAAQLATLVERERAAAAAAGRTSFLLDSGDMFTGTLSRLTEGEALLEMMLLMRYDAMGVGNHEFDYGWQPFEQGISRVPFPILCCNVRHRGTGIRFTRPHTILERDGVRLGVIGVMGMRAATRTIMPSKVAELEFTDPVAEARASVAALRPHVDVIVVLGHQGLPGPMQSDAEADRAVQRPLDEDLAFCGAVPGIDVYIAAHSHHGLEQPLIHPDTGTLITQTYGYGTRLGRIALTLDDGKLVQRDAELLMVRTDDLTPHPTVAARIARYRAKVADEIGPPLGRVARRLTRRYHAESPLGSLCADVMRDTLRADVGITNAGGLRADLPEGPIDRGHVVDAFPFLNAAWTVEMPGGALRSVLEHGCSLEAGMVQVSGLVARYDLSRPVGSRVLSVEVGGRALEAERRYLVSTNSFLAEGGDGYAGFLQGRIVDRGGAMLNDLMADYVKRAGVIDHPRAGRLIPQRG